LLIVFALYTHEGFFCFDSSRICALNFDGEELKLIHEKLSQSH
jgi:hypothetical protein